MKNVTLNDLGALLGVVDVDYIRDEDALIDLALDPEEVKFCIIYEVRGQWAHGQAWSDFKVKPGARLKALKFCNEWNAANPVPRAFLQHDSFTLDWSLSTNLEISEEYVKENHIELFREAVVWFAEEVDKEFDAEKDFVFPKKQASKSND